MGRRRFRWGVVLALGLWVVGAGCSSDSGSHFLDVGPPSDAMPVPRQLLDARFAADATGVGDDRSGSADAGEDAGVDAGMDAGADAGAG